MRFEMSMKNSFESLRIDEKIFCVKICPVLPLSSFSLMGTTGHIFIQTTFSSILSDSNEFFMLISNLISVFLQEKLFLLKISKYDIDFTTRMEKWRFSRRVRAKMKMIDHFFLDDMKSKMIG